MFFGSRQQTQEARCVILFKTSVRVHLFDCLVAILANFVGFIGAKIGVLVSLLRRQNKDNEATRSTPLQLTKTSLIFHKNKHLWGLF